MRPHLARFGITRVARHTGLDKVGIPVWCAYTPNAKSIVVAQGKGVTDDDARTSATMEALERAVGCDPQVRIVATSIAALEGEGRRADPLPQLIARGQDLLSPHEVIDWVASSDLSTGETVFVPYEAVTLDRTRPNNRYWQSSDGLASANTIEEAVYHGLLERIERDAHTLWQLLKLPKQQATCIDPACLGSSDVTRLQQQLAAADLELRLFDITSDVQVPTFTALLGPAHEIKANTARYVEVTYGCGTHPAPEQAAVRALTEAAQSRLTYISGARDDVFREVFERPLPKRIRALFDAKPRQIARPHTSEVLDATGVLNRLRAVGVHDVFAVSLNDPDLPFAVVKVLIPGLENPEGARRQRFGSRAIAKALFA
ncbi:YcaO-like family protein [Rhizobium sp. TH2]|uniref:YcaO-like family protein n=1 Tax=Rhizobium sp. TH2 TaxID=2775403 RepID=UPI002156F8A4|nr:YcaO-like family protein [Rhizobium sp. TH2]